MPAAKNAANPPQEQTPSDAADVEVAALLPAPGDLLGHKNGTAPLPAISFLAKEVPVPPSEMVEPHSLSNSKTAADTVPKETSPAERQAEQIAGLIQKEVDRRAVMNARFKEPTQPVIATASVAQQAAEEDMRAQPSPGTSLATSRLTRSSSLPTVASSMASVPAGVAVATAAALPASPSKPGRKPRAAKEPKVPGEPKAPKEPKGKTAEPHDPDFPALASALQLSLPEVGEIATTGVKRLNKNLAVIGNHILSVNSRISGVELLEVNDFRRLTVELDNARAAHGLLGERVEELSDDIEQIRSSVTDLRHLGVVDFDHTIDGAPRDIVHVDRHLSAVQGEVYTTTQAAAGAIVDLRGHIGETSTRLEGLVVACTNEFSTGKKLLESLKEAVAEVSQRQASADLRAAMVQRMGEKIEALERVVRRVEVLEKKNVELEKDLLEARGNVAEARGNIAVLQTDLANAARKAPPLTPPVQASPAFAAATQLTPSPAPSAATAPRAFPHIAPHAQPATATGPFAFGAPAEPYQSVVLPIGNLPLTPFTGGVAKRPATSDPEGAPATKRPSPEQARKALHPFLIEIAPVSGLSPKNPTPQALFRMYAKHAAQATHLAGNHAELVHPPQRRSLTLSVGFRTMDAANAFAARWNLKNRGPLSKITATVIGRVDEGATMPAVASGPGSASSSASLRLARDEDGELASLMVVDPQDF